LLESQKLTKPGVSNGGAKQRTCVEVTDDAATDKLPKLHRRAKFEVNRVPDTMTGVESSIEAYAGVNNEITVHASKQDQKESVNHVKE
jgi:hypothetical protein